MTCRHLRPSARAHCLRPVLPFEAHPYSLCNSLRLVLHRLLGDCILPGTPCLVPRPRMQPRVPRLAVVRRGCHAPRTCVPLTSSIRLRALVPLRRSRAFVLTRSNGAHIFEIEKRSDDTASRPSAGCVKTWQIAADRGPLRRTACALRGIDAQAVLHTPRLSGRAAGSSLWTHAGASCVIASSFLFFGFQLTDCAVCRSAETNAAQTLCARRALQLRSLKGCFGGRRATSVSSRAAWYTHLCPIHQSCIPQLHGMPKTARATHGAPLLRTGLHCCPTPASHRAPMGWCTGTRGTIAGRPDSSSGACARVFYCFSIATLPVAAPLNGTLIIASRPLCRTLLGRGEHNLVAAARIARIANIACTSVPFYELATHLCDLLIFLQSPHTAPVPRYIEKDDSKKERKKWGIEGSNG
ncbi:hypothetical protein C8R47DRAFT_1192373 [Mycena vitilis]|nr:hypothetical protein C8R47DRAFT_1192373 [Mycena vitilis]